VAKMGPKPKKSLDNSLNTSLEEMDSETTVKEQASHQGFLYKDTRSGKMILVDGILGSMFYAFDRVADKTCVLDTLSREFSLEQMKNSRSNFYQAFQLQDTEGNIQEKRKISTIFLDLWEKISKIDKAGHGNVVVTVPFNFQIPKFLTNSEFSVKAFQDTSNAMMDERMSAIEKKMELLQCIWDKVNVNPVPSFAAKSYSAVTRGNDDYSGTGARPKNLTVPLRAGIGRERSPSVKRGLNDGINSQNKRRNVGKPVVSGTRTQEKIRKIKSPPADIFCYGIPKGTTKQDIVDDLEEADIKITVGDIVQMSKPNETSNVISFKISVPAEDLEKALDPTVWPLRVRVREFIHYRKVWELINRTL